MAQTSLTQLIDEMLACAALERRSARVAELRAQFEARTGSFAPADPWFEARSAAFWDDALTRSAFGRELLPELEPEAAALALPLARAHRGLFRVAPEEETAAAGAPAGFRLVDEWSGAEFVVEPASEGLRDALDRAAGWIDGRVVAVPAPSPAPEEGGRLVLLAGALFHPADALEAMRALVPIAKERAMTTHDFLDALLRMDHALRSLSRVKPAFAYRKEALDARAAAHSHKGA